VNTSVVKGSHLVLMLKRGGERLMKVTPGHSWSLQGHSWSLHIKTEDTLVALAMLACLV
jgi:hypothetical protein